VTQTPANMKPLNAPLTARPNGHSEPVPINVNPTNQRVSAMAARVSDGKLANS
jgi:hypothetical protein